MLIFNDPDLVQYYLDKFADEVTNFCLHRRQWYIYFTEDHDRLDWHPSLKVRWKKIGKVEPPPNIGFFKPFEIDSTKVCYTFHFPKAVLTVNEDTIINSDGQEYNCSEYLGV